MLKSNKTQYAKIKQKVKDKKYFCNKGRFLVSEFVDDLLSSYILKTIEETGTMYIYNPHEGIYVEKVEIEIKKILTELLRNHVTNNTLNHVLLHIGGRTTVKIKVFQKDDNILCLQNGLYNLNSSKFMDFTPDIVKISKLPVYYNIEARCDKFMKFLNEILPEEKHRLVQEIFGFTLMTSYVYHKAILFLGAGSNGKSILLSTLTAMLGLDNISSESLGRLCNNRFAGSSLLGKMANVCSDISAISLSDTGMFKALTGNDYIVAEKKFKPQFKFKSYAKLFFSGNEFPKVYDTSYGFFRRWILIFFPKQFVEGKNAKLNLLKELTTKEELSGIFNWAVEGYRHLSQNQKFSFDMTPKQVREIWLKETNPEYRFFQNYVKHDVDGWISKKDLYDRYSDYIKSSGKHILPPPNVFGKNVKLLRENADFNYFSDRRKGQKNGYAGIKFS